MEQQKKQNNKHYIVEHMDDGLFDWSLAEYKKMNQYLKTSEQPKPSDNLIFTNTTQFLSKNNENNENETKYAENIKEIEKENVTFFKNKLHTYFDKDGNLIMESGKKVDFKRVCLLDMRGEKTLSPEDANEFDAFLFGGILGDHPPQDRTKELRQIGFTQRQLGKIQLTTDTAVLISKLIIQDGHKFEDIPYIDEPEMINPKNKNETVQMEGFKYVTQQYDEVTEKIDYEDKEKAKIPIMSDKIRNELLFEPLDLGDGFKF